VELLAVKVPATVRGVPVPESTMVEVPPLKVPEAILSKLATEVVLWEV